MQPAMNRFQSIESTIGGVFAVVVAFCFLLGGVIACYIVSVDRNARTSPEILSGAVGIGVVLIEGLFIWALMDAMEKLEEPRALLFAQRQPRWPVVLRPVVVLWWLIHFLAGAAATIAIERVFPAGAAWREKVILTAIPVVLILAGSYASNLFLLLAVAAAFPRQAIIEVVWRRRIVVDLMVTAVALGLGYWWFR
jgi:hypothetical protein